jgi:hypothetical protein
VNRRVVILSALLFAFVAQSLFVYFLSEIGVEVATGYFVCTALAYLCFSVLELGSHFHLARGPAGEMVEEAFIYRYGVASALSLLVVLCVVYFTSPGWIWLAIATHLPIALRTHGLSIKNDSEGVFWLGEGGAFFLAFLALIVSGSAPFAIVLLAVVRSGMYLTQLMRERVLFSGPLTFRSAVLRYLRARALSGVAARSYFAVTWPVMPLVLSASEYPFVERHWAIVERLCAAIVVILPVALRRRDVAIRAAALGLAFISVAIGVAAWFVRAEWGSSLVEWELFVLILVAAVDAVVMCLLIRGREFDRFVWFLLLAGVCLPLAQFAVREFSVLIVVCWVAVVSATISTKEPIMAVKRWFRRP